MRGDFIVAAYVFTGRQEEMVQKKSNSQLGYYLKLLPDFSSVFKINAVMSLDLITQ